MCPVGRGCGLENRLDVKISGVQIPNTAFIWLYGIKVITPDCLSEIWVRFPIESLWCIAVMVAEWLAKPSGRNAV